MQEVLLPLDEADRVCGLCGSGLHAWEGQTEDCEQVTVVERNFVLRRVRRQKYRCHQGCTPVTASAPPRLIPGGRYSLEFAVHVALMKYGFHLPLARQQRLYLREGLVVEAQTLWDQLDALATHLQKSYEALLAEVFTSPLIHADGPAPATLAFCWAHVRRKFFEAKQFAPLAKRC
ncbi:transposase [Corallococcus sp. bb12-1]|uniref:IS66 family transposase n=1 Tax=Corallococcus sp. bb12-1 TaxID=2996784 RepID=UPI00226EFE76|nr:transposase [Corallococcus sp. bb12-1]MCY1043201.1 transposase [Corallococcus sp. bb12-1]